MTRLKSPKTITSSDDDFLYNYLYDLCTQIKIVQGGSALASTLKNHDKIRNYLVSKQIVYLYEVEGEYFNNDGSLNSLAVSNHHLKNRTLQNN